MENTILQDLKNIFADKAISYEDFVKALDANKIKLGNLESGNYIAKEKYTKLEEDYKSLEGKNKELMDMSEKYQKEITKLNKENISKDEYDKRIEEIQKNHKDEIDTLKKSMEETQRNSVISSYLDRFDIVPNCKEFVISKLDKSLIKVDGDKVLGIDDQMKDIMTNYSSLFKAKAPVGSTPMASNTSSITNLDEKQSQIEAIRNEFNGIK
nr:MAG TPA: minor structural protein [Caudoviricetes sp.]